MGSSSSNNNNNNNNNKQTVNILVAGAGIAGCAAAQGLQAQGVDYLLLEKNPDPGGLTRSISLGDAYFDYTGHFLHLAKHKSPSNLPYAHQRDEDWQLINRQSVVYIEKDFIPAPFQYHLGFLPKAIGEECLEYFRHRPRIDRVRSFKEYLLTGFGQGICDYFLFPYNEKILACCLDELSVEAVKRFFPQPDQQRIECGSRPQPGNSSVEYNSTFWYPKKYGIGLLARGLAEGLRGLQTGCPIERVSLESKKVYTGAGEVSYDQMLTSLPLKTFCYLTDSLWLKKLAALLRHTRVFCLNLLLRGKITESLADCHWVYVPQKNIPFYRLGIYSNISTKMNPPETTALYIETALLDNSPLPDINHLIDRIFTALEKEGWARRSECLVIGANWINCAYILFDHRRQAIFNQILSILHDYQVYPIGRYGLWDYISMEDAILSGIHTACSLLAQKNNKNSEFIPALFRQGRYGYITP